VPIIPFPMPLFLLPSTYLSDGLGKLSATGGLQLAALNGAQTASAGLRFSFACLRGMGAAKLALHATAELGSSSQRVLPLQYPSSSRTPGHPLFPSLFMGAISTAALRLQRCHLPREDTILPPTSSAHNGWVKISIIILQGATGTHTSARRARKKQYVYHRAISSKNAALPFIYAASTPLNIQIAGTLGCNGQTRD